MELRAEIVPIVLIVERTDRFLHTVSPLRIRQIIFLIKQKILKNSSLKRPASSSGFLPVSLPPALPSSQSLRIEGDQITITNLNLSKSWRESVEWGERDLGRLWNYHLQYADFLQLGELPDVSKKELMTSLYRALFDDELTPEPYPASLRSINMIRWLSSDPILADGDKEELHSALWSELEWISRNPEYHLSGNHLLENAFALLMGSVAFNRQSWRDLALSIFRREMKSQILPDGAHAERSVMYHQRMLQRVLELLSILEEKDPVRKPIEETAEKMTSWLRQMHFKNGEAANFGDATASCSALTPLIVKSAASLGITGKPLVPLGESGFRTLTTGPFELFIKVAGIEPDWQPAHQHADSLSFLLQIGGTPLITDRGISTYDPGPLRQEERSTASHNTVSRPGLNTADLWAVFRIGRKPQVELLSERENELEMRLRYRPFRQNPFIHHRRVKVTEKLLTIEDRTEDPTPVAGFLHFHPDAGSPDLHTEGKVQRILFPDIGCEVRLTGAEPAMFTEYRWCEGFNRTLPALRMEYRFIGQSTLEFLEMRDATRHEREVL